MRLLARVSVKKKKKKERKKETMSFAAAVDKTTDATFPCTMNE